MSQDETRAAVWRATYRLVDKSESVDGLLNLTVYDALDVVMWRAVQGVMVEAAGDAVERDSEHPVLEDFLRFRSSAV